MSRFSSNRADRLPVVHHIPSVFLLTRASSPVHVHAFVSDSRVENKQFARRERSIGKFSFVLPTTSRNHAKVHPGLWRCRQWHWEGCNRYSPLAESPASHLCFNPNHVPPSASSTGLLLKMAGLKVTAIKIDPYMNIDAGTMRPQEHGAIKKGSLSSPQS
jgi:hypothetical protein